MVYGGSEDDDGGFECDGDADDNDYGCSDDGVVYGDVDDSMWPTVIAAFTEESMMSCLDTAPRQLNP